MATISPGNIVLNSVVLYQEQSMMWVRIPSSDTSTQILVLYGEDAVGINLPVII